MRISKRQSDLYKGVNFRLRVDAVLNAYFTCENKPLQVTPMHDTCLFYNMSEKQKNNKTRNRILPAPTGKSMGLYRIVFKDCVIANGMPLIYLQEKKGGVYLKLPHEYAKEEKIPAYLEILKNANYRIIIVNEKIDRFSIPIHFSDIVTHWEWSLQKTKGNKNRLQFLGPVSKITLYPLYHRGLVYPSLANLLEKEIEEGVL